MVRLLSAVVFFRESSSTSVNVLVVTSSAIKVKVMAYLTLAYCYYVGVYDELQF